MNLYKIAQTENDNYDTFDSAIVAAESDEAARRIHPVTSWGNRDCDWREGGSNEGWLSVGRHMWASHPDKVTVTLIGRAEPDASQGVILASFNAG